MIENVKNGMTVYWYRDLDSYIEKGIVKDPTVEDSGCRGIHFIKKVDWVKRIDDEGKEFEPSYGTSGARLDQTFLTVEEAMASQKSAQEKHIEDLKSEITDLASLLEFPLKHTIMDGEYCDWFAQRVYKDYVELFKKGDFTYSTGVGK